MQMYELTMIVKCHIQFTLSCMYSTGLTGLNLPLNTRISIFLRQNVKMYKTCIKIKIYKPS